MLPKLSLFGISEDTVRFAEVGGDWITTAAHQFALSYANKNPTMSVTGPSFDRSIQAGWAMRMKEGEERTQKRGDQLNRLVEAGFAYLCKRATAGVCRAGRGRKLETKAGAAITADEDGGGGNKTKW